jgi:hypothetical protein
MDGRRARPAASARTSHLHVTLGSDERVLRRHWHVVVWRHAHEPRRPYLHRAARRIALWIVSKFAIALDLLALGLMPTGIVVGQSNRDIKGNEGLASELGYADQAHFTRDFTATIGVTPGTYVGARR